MDRQLKPKIKTNNESKQIKVRIIKAPLVDNRILKQIVCARGRAVVL